MTAVWFWAWDIIGKTGEIHTLVDYSTVSVLCFLVSLYFGPVVVIIRGSWMRGVWKFLCLVFFFSFSINLKLFQNKKLKGGEKYYVLI